MKTASEIFLTVGVPIVAGPQYRGFRAFNEHDIAEIQRDAFNRGWSDGFQEALTPDNFPDTDRREAAFKEAQKP